MTIPLVRLSQRVVTLIRIAVAGLAMGFTLSPAAPPTPALIKIAAAANMARVIDPLTIAFHREHPEFDLRVSTAATGNLVAQIDHGAPFELLLSADPDYPAVLLNHGTAVAGSARHFATGLLVLWPAPAEGFDSLRKHPPARLAIANPDTAPFGRAARTSLQQAGLWLDLEPSLIIGENAAQTLHFVQSGNAPLGFVAASLLTAEQRAHALPIPSTDRALEHTAVLLNPGVNSAGAQIFLQWLVSDSAQGVLAAHGYQPIKPATDANLGIDAPR